MQSLQEKAPILYRLSEFICNPDAIYQQDFHQAKRITADTIGVAFSGIKTDAFNSALQHINTLFGSGEHRIWGSETRSTLFGSVFYNTLSVSSTDFDEGHRTAVGHPASLVVPVAIALGTHLKRSADDILTSIILGYEIGTRFSHARRPEKIETYSSGRWGAIGSAATSAFLLGLDPTQTMHALSLAAVLSPAMLGGSIDVSTGSMAKEGVPWAAYTGTQSSYLAKSGFIGPYLFVDEHDGYDTGQLTDGLGGDCLINSNYFKPYSCCRWLHTAIREAIELREEFDLIHENINNVKVEVFGRAISLANSKYPENPVQAQFHLPYVVACALIYGKVLPKHFTMESIADPEIRLLIDKISLVEKNNYTTSFPKSILSMVHIETRDGEKMAREIAVTPWDTSLPPSDEELRTKFIEQVPGNGPQMWESIMAKDFSRL